MADPFSLAASIFATIQIADRVVTLCKYYIETIRDAPADLRAILLEISTLKTIFENIKFLIDCDNGQSVALKSLDGAFGPIASCEKAMQELESLFSVKKMRDRPRDNSKKRKAQAALAIAALAWPLKESKAKKLLDEIKSIKNTTSLAITTDTALVLQLHIAAYFDMEFRHGILNLRQKTEIIHEVVTESQKWQVYKWLESIDPSSLHNRALRNYEPGTCDWAARLPEWSEFLGGTRRCLWIHGIPGAGKTVLASQLIKRIEEHCADLGSAQYLSAFYYCHFSHNQDESASFLKWVLSRLCRQGDIVSDRLWKLFRYGGTPTLTDLLAAIAEILKSYSTVFITVDAVDESNPREDLLKILRDLATDSRFAKIRLLLTSREYLDIEVVLNEFSTPISMRNPELDADIGLYTKSRLGKERRMRQWPQAVLEETYEALTKGAKGMFRWVVCQIDVLRRLKCDATIIRRELGQLPRTLNESYDRIFRHIPDEDLLIVNSAMRWMCFEVRVGEEESIPLNVLADAVDADLETSPQQNLLHDAESLRELCGCLLTITPLALPHGEQCLMVSFAHYTVLEYLTSGTRHQPDAYFSMETSLLVLERSKIVLVAALSVNENDISECSKISDGKASEIRELPTFGSHCAFLALRIITNFNDVLSEDNELANLVYDLLDEEKAHWPVFENVLNFIWGWLWEVLKNADQVLQPTWEALPDAKIHVLMRLLLLGCLGLAEKWMQTGDLRAVFQARIKFKYLFDNPWDEGDLTEWSFHGSITDCFAVVGPAIQNYEAFRLLFNTGAGIFDPQSTLLCFMGIHNRVHAEHCQDWCVLERLLSLGAEPDFAGCRVTMLQIAVATLDVDGTRTLLEAGADPNARGCPAASPLPVTNGLRVFDCISGITPLRICRSKESLERFGYLNSWWYITVLDSDYDAQFIIETLLLQYGAEE